VLCRPHEPLATEMGFALNVDNPYYDSEHGLLVSASQREHVRAHELDREVRALGLT